MVKKNKLLVFESIQLKSTKNVAERLQREKENVENNRELGEKTHIIMIRISKMILKLQ